MDRSNSDIWTIELNLDDDFAYSCAYHIDELERTILKNIQHADTKQKTNRWVLVGLAYGFERAAEKMEELRYLLCQKHGRKPRNLED